MRKLALIPLALALIGNAQAQTRQAVARPCITAPELEGLALYLMPEVIRTAGETCRPHLPAGARLLRSGALIERYRAESAGAWPMAQAALGKIVDGDARRLLASETGRAMVPALVAPMIAGEIKPADCGAIDRGVQLLDPLPPRNTAGLLAMTLQLVSKPGDRRFNVCRFQAPAR